MEKLIQAVNAIVSNEQLVCSDRFYLNQNNQCIHYLLPPSFQTVIGSILIMIIAGLSSMAGLGGGGPSLVVFILLFNYLPKDANMIVFTSILGATLGNFLNQMRKSYNGEPLIQYRFAFVSMPIMFIGSFFGVLLNKLLPSLAICSIIVYQSSTSLPKIYERFKVSYKKQSQQILLHQQNQDEDKKQLIQQEIVNPFSNPQNVYIFKNVILLVVVFIFMLCLRGTQKIDSLIGILFTILGIERCSLGYWILFFLSLAIVSLFGFKNLETLKIWMAPSQSLDEQLKQIKNPVLYNIKDVIYKSLLAGVFSGFGLGGGLFLVPMYRELGCNPLQATASTTFSIVITALINCLQGMLIGVIKFQDFGYFLVISGGGSYLISIYLSKYLRKQNRLSYVQGLLYALLLLAVINIPISLLVRYINSGYDSSVVLSFGTLC